METKKNNVWIIILLAAILICSISLNIYTIFSSSNNSYSGNDKIDSLNFINNSLSNKIDSLNSVLRVEVSKYDSLIIELDSLESRYSEINNKYELVFDSVKYLDADESIFFLIKKAEL